jgi:hypothetical protein
MITVTEGVQDAIGFLGLTWRKWLPMVVIVAGFSALISLLVGTASTTDLYYTDPYTGRVILNDTEFRHYLAAAFFGGLGTGVLTMVASWVFSATAISGLRNRPVTAGWVAGRGLLALLAGILLGLAIGAVVVVATILVVIMAVAAPPLGVLLAVVLILGGIPILIYLTIRLVFVTLAIFDGFGVIEAMRESWRLSGGAVLRMLGWGIMAWLIELGFTILAGIAAAPFSAGGTNVVASFGASAITLTGSCFTVYMMAVLYESQRARMDPALYGPPPMPFNPYGYSGMPPAGYGNPSAPPAGYGYAPPPPVGFSYPGTPAPTAPGGWNSGQPGGWNSGQPGGWNSGQPGGWNSGQPGGWGAPQGWGPPPGWTPPPTGPAAPTAATAWGADQTDPTAPSSGPAPAPGPAPEPPTSQEPPANS